MPELAQGPPFSLSDRIWQTIYRLAFPLARRWWRLRGQQHQGARPIVPSGIFPVVACNRVRLRKLPLAGS
jgi:hypothetical protein